jgi:signal transduction histidine kinase
MGNGRSQPSIARVGRLAAIGRLLGPPRSRLPVALSLAMAIPLAALVYLQSRSISDLGESSAAVLRQLSRHAADSIAHGLEDALQTPPRDPAARVLPAVHAERLRRESASALVPGLLAAWPAPAGWPALDVTLLDETGRVVFPAGGSADALYVDERPIPLEPLPEGAAPRTPPAVWRLRTGYGGRTIDEIVGARQRSQHAQLWILAAVMAAGIVLVTRAFAREVRLAHRRSDFVLGISHDLKTPLAHIQLFAESLELGRVKTPERAHEYHRIIVRQAEKLTRLVNHILDFSRIDAGLREYQRERRDLVSVTRQVLDSLDGPDRFDFRLLAAPQPVWVSIDQDAATQAIENLVSNAMKYSPDGCEVLLEVDQFDCYGRVRVTDRGVGIPRPLQRKIFRKFYRVADATGTAAPGCGLGLAIVDHVMRAHGGFVSVDSEPRRGSTFTLHFPIHQGATQRDEADLGHRGRAADVARPA